MGYVARVDEGPEQRLPSTSQVIAELKLLGEREGISPTKIRELAPLLQRLPVTEDYRQLRRFSPDDLHIAAYGNIGCLLERAIPDVMLQTILILTLRYDYTRIGVKEQAGWELTRRASNASARHDLIMAMLHYKKSQYFTHVNRAQQELANELVFRERTPCREAREEQLIALPAEVAIDQLLSLFSVSGQAMIRERLASRTLEGVDLKELVLNTHLGGSSSHLARPISIDHVEFKTSASSVFQSYVEQALGKYGGATAGAHAQFLTGHEMSTLILGSRKKPFLNRLESILNERESRLVGKTKHSFSPAEYPVDMIKRSYQHLAKIMKSEISQLNARTMNQLSFATRAVAKAPKPAPTRSVQRKPNG